MKRIFITFLATAIFYGTSVSAVCDNYTYEKMEGCVFWSDLFQPQSIPTTEEMVTRYCYLNVTSNCVLGLAMECDEDVRQTRLINSLITQGAIFMGQRNLCAEPGNQGACFRYLKGQPTQYCLKDAVGKLANVGDTNLRESLDIMCTFFADYMNCLENVCRDFIDAMDGIKYRYCSMSSDKKQDVITGRGSASFICVSFMAIVIAGVASHVLLVI